MVKDERSYQFSHCRKIIYIFFATTALLFGGLIYILERPSDHIFFQWINSAGFEYWFDHLRKSSLIQNSTLPDWIIFSLPNGLWAFAYSIIMTIIWSQSNSFVRYFWMASIPLMVLGFEFLQYTGNLAGTFCIRDVIFGLLGILIGFLIGINSKKYEKATF